jgi:hypothetical protein
MNVQKVIYSEKGNPLLVINGAKFFKASVMEKHAGGAQKSFEKE